MAPDADSQKAAIAAKVDCLQKSRAGLMGAISATESSYRTWSQSDSIPELEGRIQSIENQLFVESATLNGVSRARNVISFSLIVG